MASGAPDSSQRPLTPTPVPISMMFVAAVAAAMTASWAPIAGLTASIPSSIECCRACAISARSTMKSSANFQLDSLFAKFCSSFTAQRRGGFAAGSVSLNECSAA